MSRLLQLPAELQENIFNYCSVGDIKELASVSKDLYLAVQHLLWREVSVDWNVLQRKSALPKNLERLKLTKEITFDDNCEEATAQTHPTRWAHVARGFKHILRKCERKKLTCLRVNGLLADNGVKFSCEWLVNLKEICLRKCHYTTILTWRAISVHPSLKKVTIDDCRMCNLGIKTICESETIKEVNLKECQYITDACVEYICKAEQLKRLSVSHNRNITVSALRYLTKLRNLDYLKLEYTDSDDEFRCLCQLTITTVERTKDLHRLIVSGFYEFASSLECSENDCHDERKTLPQILLQLLGQMKNIKGGENNSECLELSFNQLEEQERRKFKINWKFNCLC